MALLKVDLDDVAFWMDAIRNSDDRYRTLESFWKGQLRSKEWLVENLEQMVATYYKDVNIVIHGGWNGVLASLIFNSKIPAKHITNVDVDPNCEETAYTVNKRYEMDGKFTHVTADMKDYTYDVTPDIVINTSCEHVTQETYDAWLENIPDTALVVVQGNNYYELDEHIRCAADGNEFLEQSRLRPLWRGAMELNKYTRYMIIGKKV